MVRTVAVREDVEKQFAARFEPMSDATHQFGPIFHVFEHLNGNDPVKAPCCRGEVIHVTGDNLDIFKTALGTLTFNIGPLGGGVGNCGNAGLRVVLGHPQGERSPATTEF